MRSYSFPTPERDTISADMLATHDRRPRHYSGGRVCSYPGCHTLLSIYNGRPRCALHDYDPYLSRVAHARQPTAA